MYSETDVIWALIIKHLQKVAILVSPKSAPILLATGYASTSGLLKPAIFGHPGTHLIISKQAYYRLKVHFG